MRHRILLLSHGGDHGGLTFVRPRVGCARRTAIFHERQVDLSQCDDHFDEWRRAFQVLDRGRSGVQRGDGGPDSQSIPGTRLGGTQAPQADGTPVASDTGVSGRLEDVSGNVAAGIGLGFQCLVAGSSECSFETADGYQLQRRSTRSHCSSSWIFVPAPQAHNAGQARRGGISEGRGQAAQAEKKRLPPMLAKS